MNIKEALKQTDPQEKLRSENEHLRSVNSQQETQIKKFLKDQGRFAELVQNAAAAIPPVSPYSTYTPKKSSSNQKNIGMVLKVSDWQIGEVIDPKETEGFGRFNYSVAKQRVFMLVDKIIAHAEVQRKGGFALPQLDIFSEADLVSGNIHYELDVTNEWPVPIAIGKASELFAEMVRRLSTSFEHIKIWEMSADNHGRLTRKNQSKQGALNNYSRLAHEFANARLATLIEEEKVSVELGEGTKLLADVVGQKFLISHGHGILSSLGIPYYGLERARAREAVKRMGTDKTFQYYSIGHYHVASVIAGNILVNGNLPGTTEFDHMQGRNSPPTQVSFLVNPKHGIFDWTPWNLTKGTSEAN
jgi:hypothetical protein